MSALWTYQQGSWASPARWVRHEVEKEAPTHFVLRAKLRGIEPQTVRIPRQKLEADGYFYCKSWGALFHAEPELQHCIDRDWHAVPEGYELRPHEGASA